MLADTMFAQKSGQGTAMFSRPGKSTTYQYLCFQEKANEEEEYDQYAIGGKMDSKSRQQGIMKFKQKLINRTNNSFYDPINEQEDEINQFDKIQILQQLQQMKQQYKQANKSFGSFNQSQIMARNDDILTNNKGYNSVFQGVTRDKAMIYILNKKDLKNDNMNKYRPRFDSIDKKVASNTKFDEIKTLPRPKNEEPHSCQRLQRLFKSRILNQASEIGGDQQSLVNAFEKRQGSMAESMDEEQIKKSFANQSQIQSQARDSSYINNPQISQTPKTNNFKKRNIFSKNNNTASQVQQQSELNNINLSYENIETFPDARQNRIPYLVDFDKVKSRDFSYQSIVKVNDARFENIDKFPKFLSCNKHVGSPEIKKYSKRKPFINIKPISKEFGSSTAGFYPGNPQYDPKFENRRINLSLGIPDFSKVPKRKLNNNLKPYQMPENYNDENIKRAQSMLSTFKKVAKPIGFDKILPRDNKMFFISEGYNLDQKEDPFIEKFLLMDMVSKNQRNNHGTSNLLNHSFEVANNIEDIDKFLYSRNLSLEEKILSGYYKA